MKGKHGSLRLRSLAFVAAMATLIVQGLAGSGHPADTWVLRSTEPMGGVAFGKGIFVAGGLSGIFTSPDGADWTLKDGEVLPSNIVFVNDRFFAVGSQGIHVSGDGESWERVFSGAHVLDIAYGKNTYAAVGFSGVHTSADGETWTDTGFKWPADCYPDEWTVLCHFKAVAFGNNTFTAVGIATAEDPHKNIYTSTDGKKWTARLDAEEPVHDVTFAEGVFLAVSSGELMGTSTNGSSWVQKEAPCVEWLYSVGYGNGSFVAVGEWGRIITSPDATSWTLRDSGVDFDLRGVAFGSDTFVAVGDGGIVQSGTVLGPACNYAFTPAYKNFSANAGTVTVNVTATGDPYCPSPPVAAGAGWVTATLQSWKANKGPVKVAVPANTSSLPRSTEVKIGPLGFPVTQAGKACTFKKLAPSSLSFSKAGGIGQFAFTVIPSDCAWVAAGSTLWILAAPPTGAGDGTIDFTVAPNPGTANRSGSVLVNLLIDPKKKITFTVSQSGK